MERFVKKLPDVRPNIGGASCQYFPAIQMRLRQERKLSRWARLWIVAMRLPARRPATEIGRVTLHGCPQASPPVISADIRPGGPHLGRSYFHLHLVSDSTGETLIAASRAASAQYQGVASIEHVYPLVRTPAQLDRVITEIENAPGIVLFTLVDSGPVAAARSKV